MTVHFIIFLFLVLAFFGALLSVLSIFVNSKADSTEKRILNLLPGINCGQCGYPGCEAYAKAISKGEVSCSLCRPAGADVAVQIAQMLGRNCEADRDYEEELFTPREVAYIHDNICNGCSRCKKACRVDAISGILKQPHIVDARECIGCGDCIKTCPHNCIEMIRQEYNLSHFNWNIHSVTLKNGRQG
ncbi:MAG: RnfABCDGE type electron transport complex subunit B [Succinivibrio sp.]